MGFEIRENSGTLHKNSKREKDTHPNLRGECLIDGVAYWVDAWTKDARSGKWLSLSFKRKDQPTGADRTARDTRTHAERKRGAAGFDDMDDDIPF
jgi:hypothetical protein